MDSARIRRLALTNFRNYRAASIEPGAEPVVLVGANGAGKLLLSVTNPDSGSATEELEIEYAADPIEIGFNSRYLLDIAAQIEGEVAVLKLADPGSPTLIQDKDAKGALYVLMPMRV